MGHLGFSSCGNMILEYLTKNQFYLMKCENFGKSCLVMEIASELCINIAAMYGSWRPPRHCGSHIGWLSFV